MVNRSRRCVHYALRIVNMTINFIGVLMIIYSLWALKKWKAIEVKEGSSEYDLLYPWFIFTFLAIGIVVCFCTLCGHVVANSISVLLLTSVSFIADTEKYEVILNLLKYIVFVCGILFLQVGAVIFIFFKDWVAEIDEDYTGQYTEFEEFVTFHLTLCRSIVLLIVLLQAVGFLLAVMLWAWRPEPSTWLDDSCDGEASRSSLKQSFLICNDSQPSLPSPLTSNTNNERRTLVEEIG
ncbi:Tetraspanin-19 [Nymphaea thermarum]|nr:Tetraspanin-19 [Nymphaea thermarum]